MSAAVIADAQNRSAPATPGSAASRATPGFASTARPVPDFRTTSLQTPFVLSMAISYATPCNGCANNIGVAGL